MSPLPNINTGGHWLDDLPSATTTTSPSLRTHKTVVECVSGAQLAKDRLQAAWRPSFKEAYRFDEDESLPDPLKVCNSEERPSEASSNAKLDDLDALTVVKKALGRASRSLIVLSTKDSKSSRAIWEPNVARSRCNGYLEPRKSCERCL